MMNYEESAELYTDYLIVVNGITILSKYLKLRSIDMLKSFKEFLNIHPNLNNNSFSVSSMFLKFPIKSFYLPIKVSSDISWTL